MWIYCILYICLLCSLWQHIYYISVCWLMDNLVPSILVFMSLWTFVYKFVLCVCVCVCVYKFYVCVCLLSCFSHVQLFVTLWTVACQLLCPWDSPGKNTGVGCHDLL